MTFILTELTKVLNNAPSREIFFFNNRVSKLKCTYKLGF